MILQDLDGLHNHPEVLNTLNQMQKKKTQVDIAGGIADPSNIDNLAVLKGHVDEYNKMLQANKPLIDNHDRLVNRINFLPDNVRNEAAKMVIEGRAPIRIDKEKAQQYFDLLNKPEYQQLIMKQVDPTGKLPPEMRANKYKEYIRDKRDLLKDAISGIRPIHSPGPVENIAQGAIGGLVGAAGAFNPLTTAFSAFGAVGYEPKSEKIAHIANLMQDDPAFASVFKAVPQREPGVAESIAKGTAEIVPLLPSFKLAGETVAKLAPRLNPISRTISSVGKGPGRVLTGIDEVRRLAHNILTAPLRGALQFGAQSIATRQQPAKGAVQGAAFETAGAVTDVALNALPKGYKFVRYVLPVARALASGTTFALGSVAASKLSGEKMPNLWEELGKGVTLSHVPSSGRRNNRKIQTRREIAVQSFLSNGRRTTPLCGRRESLPQRA